MLTIMYMLQVCILFVQTTSDNARLHVSHPKTQGDPFDDGTWPYPKLIWQYYDCDIDTYPHFD